MVLYSLYIKKKVLAIKRLIGDNLSGLPVPEGIINFLLWLVGDWERVACWFSFPRCRYFISTNQLVLLLFFISSGHLFLFYPPNLLNSLAHPPLCDPLLEIPIFPVNEFLIVQLSSLHPAFASVVSPVSERHSSTRLASSQQHNHRMESSS